VTNVTTTQNLLISYYTGLGSWFGLATSASSPGQTNSPANEASGGTPAYARIETNWSVTGPAAIGGSVTFNVPPGTYGYMLLCSASAGNFMVDWAPVQQQVCANQTTITIIPLAQAS